MVASERLVVVGAGSWGTALAIQFARAGRPTTMWGRECDDLDALERDRENARYLPGAAFPDLLEIEANLDSAVTSARDILVVVPSHAFRAVLSQAKSALTIESRVAWATKGFELDSGKLPHEVAREVIGANVPLAVLSGPTFAAEVGRGLPTAMTVASADVAFGRDIVRSISSDMFRAYLSDDIVGVEVGGAVKNVLAIGAGLSDGLGFGANTRIALISRGLVEMTRLGLALGAKQETFMGLAGMGDLVLTCTDNLSRNRRMGLALAAGKTVAEAEEEIQQVVEGVVAAKAVYQKAQSLGIEMPIVEQIHAILYEGVKPADAVRKLMRRALTTESGERL
ncbi:MAG: NAD(P)H-dependent glycerol-3-phosphate dehydrogenase [Pseudomonadota bacterium]